MQSEKMILRVLAVVLAAAAPWAHAQYAASLAPALRHASMSEYGQSGERIVQESGWLPGIGGKLAYRSGPWEAYGAATLFQADLDYDGQLQNGRPYRSRTGTRMADAQLGLRYRLFADTELVASLGIDSWQRNIKGGGGAIGLREHTRSSRVSIGVEQAWQIAHAGKLTAGASLIHAAPERPRIEFSGVLDDTSLRTRSANGVALMLRYQPEGMPSFQFGAGFDYMKVPRSAAAPVTRNGRPAGEVTQPEHVRQNLTLFVKYLF